jgi:hypothetical protein
MHPVASWQRQIDEFHGACRDHLALPSVHAHASVIGSGIGEHDVRGDAAT